MRPDARPNWDIGDVLDRTDLSVLLDELTQPSGRLGPGRKWHCPVDGHDDHRASVTMFRDRHGHERWRCWSADHRGDAVDLVMQRTGRDRVDSIDWLANRAGMMPDQPLPPIPRRAASPAPVIAMVVDPAVHRYVALCERVLQGPQGRPVREWLNGRGIDDQTIAANHIGADLSRSFMRRPRGLPFGAGMAAVFPALDRQGDVAYVQARYLDPDATGRKYDNPSAAMAPHPRLAWPVGDVHRHDVLLVCEGIPDGLIAAQAGFQSVALLGSRTPDETVAARIADAADERDSTVVVIADADAAGRSLASTLGALLADLDVEIRTLMPPDGLDLNGWALADPGWSSIVDSQLTDLGVDVAADPSIELEVTGW